MLKKLLIFTLLNLESFAAEVLIWEPDKEHTYGHAAITTKTYHMSFWPDGDIKNWVVDANSDRVINRAMDVSPIGSGVRGSLVFHEKYDNYLNGYKYPDGKHKEDKHPKKIFLDINSGILNRAYEDVLSYNDITPDNVTIEAGVDILLNTKEVPSISLPENKTMWSLDGNISSPWKFSRYKQSCTTFSLNLIRYSALLDIEGDEIQDYFTSNKLIRGYRCRMLSVPNFELLIEKHKNNIKTTEEKQYKTTENEVRGILKPKQIKRRSLTKADEKVEQDQNDNCNVS